MVLGLPPSVKIYFATELVDMRNGIDGLRAVVEQILKKSPDEVRNACREQLLPDLHVGALTT
jgi:hypothetical protein